MVLTGLVIRNWIDGCACEMRCRGKVTLEQDIDFFTIYTQASALDSSPLV